VAFLFHIYEIAKIMPNCVPAFIEAMGRLRHYRGRDFHSVQSRQSQGFPFSGFICALQDCNRERERERIKHSVVQKQQDDRKVMHVDNPMLAETPCANCELHISGCE